MEQAQVEERTGVISQTKPVKVREVRLLDAVPPLHVTTDTVYHATRAGFDVLSGKTRTRYATNTAVTSFQQEGVVVIAMEEFGSSKAFRGDEEIKKYKHTQVLPPSGVGGKGGDVPL